MRDQRMGKPSNIKDGSLGNGRSIVFQTKLRELLRMAENSVSSKVSIDVSEALTGLKAVQREAKEAVKALKELETVKGLNTVIWNNIEDYSKEELIDELKRRGNKEVLVNRYSRSVIKANNNTLTYNVAGPANILIITD